MISRRLFSPDSAGAWSAPEGELESSTNLFVSSASSFHTCSLNYFFTLLGLNQCPPHALGGQGQIAYPDASSAIQRVANGGRDGDDPRLAQSFSAIRSGSILVFDQHGIKKIRQIGETRHAVIDQIGVQRLALLVDQGLEQSMAETLNGGAFVLPLRLYWIDRLSDVGDGHIFGNFDFAGFTVAGNFSAAHAGLPKQWKGLAQAPAWPNIAATDQFATRHGEIGADYFAVRDPLVRDMNLSFV